MPQPSSQSSFVPYYRHIWNTASGYEPRTGVSLDAMYYLPFLGGVYWSLVAIISLLGISRYELSGKEKNRTFPRTGLNRGTYTTYTEGITEYLRDDINYKFLSSNGRTK